MIGLFFPNRCTTGVTASGGSWLAGLPVSNVTTSELARVARSVNDDESSTIIRLDLGSSRALRAFAIINHNLSAAAQWKVDLGTSSGGTQVYAGALALWLSASFEAGLVAAGMEDAEYLRDGTPAIIVLPSTLSARYVTISISDTSNADGYVQVGRVFAGGGFIPSYNASYGLRDSWIDLSTVDQSESGAQWPTARRRLKQVEFVLDGLSLNDGETLHEMQRVLGTVDEVLYVPDITSPSVTQRYGFLGTLSEMSAIDYPYYRLRSMPLRLKQKG